MLIALIIFVSFNFHSADLESARRTISTLFTFQTMILVLSIAGLTMMSNIVSRHANVLNRVRISWLEILRETKPNVLEKIWYLYNKQLKKKGSTFSSEYRYQKVSHLKDMEIKRYLKALIKYKKYLDSKKFIHNDPDIRELDTNTMLLFKISCGVLLSYACSTQIKDKEIVKLSAALREIDRAEGIVIAVNFISDYKQTARRGLPILYLISIFSIALSISTLSVLSPSNFNKLLYGVNLILFIPMIMMIGYYLDQVTRRYFERNVE